MGKNQITTKETKTQGVCQKIFKAVNLSPAFQSFRRDSPTVAITDNHSWNDPAKSTISKPVALHQPPAQNGSTVPIQFKGHQIPLHEKAENMVLVEYNHSPGDTVFVKPKFKTEPVKRSPVKISAARDHQQNQDPNGVNAETVNSSPVKGLKSVKSEEYNDRFTKYIDHVKSKMKTLSSFDDDDSGVGRSAATS